MVVTSLRNKAQVQLSPPQFEYFNLIKHSIGKDPLVTVAPLEQLPSGDFLITLRAQGLRKARALATLLVASVAVGAVRLHVQVRTAGGALVKPIRRTFTPAQIVKLYQTALRTNKLFRFAAIVQIFGRAAVYPVFSARIIQFPNDDLSDFYLNYNNVAAFVFRDVLRRTISRTSIRCSTAQIKSK
ncbi:hypothetical protein PCCS19_32400 [Paenibacillus sp. CCS19]|uniref:hypothetical protein n=1 Tax=Paenibacillus sp. CCS19 TaxID=3158387 RepID=UPI00256BB347|nr:hypothetical protein [Paenibacillus cellulosilyticus]GMK40185.1 hypothetical protein PCCS19_32400 [Paenibacillus cellulosilyticus]